MRNVALPGHLSQLLGAGPADGTSLVAPIPGPVTVPGAGIGAAVSKKPGTTVDAAVAAYLKYVRADNVRAHVSNKVSIFRKFLGDRRVEALGGPIKLKKGARKADDQGAAGTQPFFKGSYLDEINPAMVQDFIEGLGVGRDTMRHYRQCFHHWYSFCLKFELYHPTTWHRPNPMAALPAYTTRNRRITFRLSGRLQGPPELTAGRPAAMASIPVLEQRISWAPSWRC